MLGGHFVLLEEGELGLGFLPLLLLDLDLALHFVDDCEVHVDELLLLLNGADERGILGVGIFEFLLDLLGFGEAVLQLLLGFVVALAQSAGVVGCFVDLCV